MPPIPIHGALRTRPIDITELPAPLAERYAAAQLKMDEGAYIDAALALRDLAQLASSDKSVRNPRRFAILAGDAFQLAAALYSTGSRQGIEIQLGILSDAAAMYDWANDSAGLVAIHMDMGAAYMALQNPQVASLQFKEAIDIAQRKLNLSRDEMVELCRQAAEAHFKAFTQFRDASPAGKEDLPVVDPHQFGIAAAAYAYPTQPLPQTLVTLAQALPLYEDLARRHYRENNASRAATTLGQAIYMGIVAGVPGIWAKLAQRLVHYAAEAQIPGAAAAFEKALDLSADRPPQEIVEFLVDHARALLPKIMMLTDVEVVLGTTNKMAAYTLQDTAEQIRATLLNDPRHIRLQLERQELARQQLELYGHVLMALEGAFAPLQAGQLGKVGNMILDCLGNMEAWVSEFQTASSVLASRYRAENVLLADDARIFRQNYKYPNWITEAGRRTMYDTLAQHLGVSPSMVRDALEGYGPSHALRGHLRIILGHSDFLRLRAHCMVERVTERQHRWRDLKQIK
jgi:hypothetical protein